MDAGSGVDVAGSAGPGVDGGTSTSAALADSASDNKADTASEHKADTASEHRIANVKRRNNGMGAMTGEYGDWGTVRGIRR